MLDYKVLKNKEDIIQASETLLGVSEFVFDLETTGLNTHAEDLEIVGMGFAWKKNHAIYIPINYDTGLSFEEIIELFRDPLESDNIGVVGQNIKYDARVCRRFGIKINNITFDTYVAHYCLFGDRFRHNLDDISMQHINIKKIRTKSLIPKKSKKNPNPSMKDMPVDDVGYYCMEDVDTTLQLTEYFRSLFKLPLYEYAKEVFYKMELPLLPVLIDMECEGAYIDEDFLDQLEEKYRARVELYSKYIFKAAGEEFSINSPVQLGKVLFDDLQIHIKLGVTVPKTSLGNYKTDVAILEKLEQDKVIRALLKVKKYQKLLKTYVTGIRNAISPVTGLIHASFNQCKVATGRLSGSAPNLQNLPQRTEEGKNIRKLFVSRWRDEGGKILACDLSQAELRILAHYANDKTLIDAFKNNEDVHDKVAIKTFKLPEDQPVPKDLRSRAKIISFGLVYGMKATKLSRDFGVTKEEAQKIIDEYLDSMPGVKQFLSDSEDFAYANGYTETLCRRRRYSSKVFSSNILDQWSGGRELTNFLIQGLNADMIKIAMVKIHDQFNQRNLKSIMFSQVHDEVVIDLHPDEIEIVPEIVKECMENSVRLNVTVLAEGQVADNWSDAH